MLGLCLGLGCRESSSTAGSAVSSQQSTAIRTLETRPRDSAIDSSGNPSNEPARSEPIAPLAEVPGSPAPDPALVALGAALFESNILSEDGKVSCRSCHDPEHGFADAVPRSAPEGRQPLAVNTPTLLNVGLLGVFNWNGRHASLGDHLDGLIQNPRVHATTWASLARRLRASADWSARFARVFPGGIEDGSARAALLAYERSMLAPGAPFDRWLAGDGSAISSPAQRGYALFKSHGCVSCHQGQLLGGNLFQRLGVIRPYYSASSALKEGDVGRFAVTGREEDRFVFRVPSLRNVAATAPYLHDGSLATLESVVGVMARYQLGRPLAHEQVEDIVAFLESLTAPAAASHAARATPASTTRGTP